MTLLACLTAGLCAIFLLGLFPGDATAEPLDEARVAEIAAMLTDAPEGLGAPIDDRAPWDERAALEPWRNIIASAEKLLSEPLPEQPDDLFLDFSRTGNRTRWQNVSGRRRGRLGTLVIAECLENKGRFIPAIEELIAALCAERTWVMPAHDSGLRNFEGKQIDIDLASSALAWEFASTHWLLGERLSADARKTLRDSVYKFVLDPYRDMYTGKRGVNWWMNTTNNWNAVCLAGVTGAALALIPERSLRAEYVAAAELYSRNFLKGFTADGYCSEGLGYWNYGFGNYVDLAETLYQATGGALDLMSLPEVEAPAQFGARIQIMGDVYPAFADCSVTARPDSRIMWFVNRKYGLGLSQYDDLGDGGASSSLKGALIYGFPNSVSSIEPVTSGAQLGLRSWFENAGILISRPAPDSGALLGVALKGGHNAEHHNHNDVGSYVVVVQDRPVLLDPGAETYTARTFSNRRYESNLLNSFGHPVPKVAGQLQQTGRKAEARVINADFTDTADTLELDLKAAYAVPELEALTRKFVYSREGKGSLTVEDCVLFSAPREFETALITDGGWLQLEDGSLFISEYDRAVQARIEVEGGEFTIETTDIHEESRVRPTRIAIGFTEPVGSARVTVTITPADGRGDDTGGLLTNGSFELASWGWQLNDGPISSISEDQAATGKRSLLINDDQKGTGSNVTSLRVPVEGKKRLVLTGQVFHKSGGGVGMYMRYLDAEGEVANIIDDKGNMAPLGTLEGPQGQWAPFRYEFETTDETVAVQMWIHSYNATQVTAYIDDLRLEMVGE